MSFRTVRRNLTKEQKERGVIYSSVLVVTNKPGFNNSEVKEVLKTDVDRDRQIRLLKDVNWFKDFAREFDLDVINYVRY